MPIYLLALATQFAADFVPSAIWSRRGWGVPVLTHARAMRVPILVDAALAPIGPHRGNRDAREHRGACSSSCRSSALLQVFARERQVRIDHALELSSAYRGTAMLLGDVIEADDEYTGTHSRDVVELVVAVADRLGLDPEKRQRAEFAALLHDVGKVKIPPEIINKPGPLDDAERALMNTHTIVGPGDARAGRRPPRRRRRHRPLVSRALGRRAAIPTGSPARRSRSKRASCARAMHGAR